MISECIHCIVTKKGTPMGHPDRQSDLQSTNPATSAAKCGRLEGRSPFPMQRSGWPNATRRLKVNAGTIARPILCRCIVAAKAITSYNAQTLAVNAAAQIWDGQRWHKLLRWLPSHHLNPPRERWTPVRVHLPSDKGQQWVCLIIIAAPQRIVH